MTTTASSTGVSCRFQLSGDTYRALVKLSNSRNCTLFMTLLAAFKALLYRYSGHADLCVGTPIAGRHHLATERLIGCFVNNLALRTSLHDNPNFLELLARVRRTTLEAYAHQNISFDQLVAALIETAPHPHLGHPLAGVFTCVLDRRTQPVPPGLPGELCIGGAGLSQGYLGDAAKTAVKFIPNPFSSEPGARLPQR